MDECFRCPPENNCAVCSGGKTSSSFSESAERQALNEALLDELMPVPEDAPSNVKNILEAQRLRLRNSCGWEELSLESLRRMMAHILAL